MLYEAWHGHLDEVVEDLRGSSLSFPAVHADKSIGAGLGSEDGDEADEALATLEVCCRAAAALGAQTLVVHLWELPSGDAAIERNLDAATCSRERKSRPAGLPHRPKAAGDTGAITLEAGAKPVWRGRRGPPR